MLTGLGKLPSHFNPNLKISPEFPRGFLFHFQPKFPRGFHPPTTTIPWDTPQNPREFARWDICIHFLYIWCVYVYGAPPTSPSPSWGRFPGLNCMNPYVLFAGSRACSIILHRTWKIQLDIPPSQHI